VIARRALLPATLAAGAAAAAGCGLFGGKAPPEPPKPIVYSLCLDASPRLNWYNGTANTLYVRAYQLSTADTFVQTDPARMVEPGFTMPGVEGAAIEKTIFPGSKTTVEIRQQPDATTLGVVAFYYEATGPVKARRPLLQRGDEPAKDAGKESSKGAAKESPKQQPGCILLGANGIDTP
jgi:type VI secretion system VasD/TssJ family lipoprotein